MDHWEGFEELLQVAGRTFQFGTEQFRGLVKTLEPSAEEYDLTPTDDDTVLLAGFRSKIPSIAIKVGVSLTDSEGFIYRITHIRRSPSQEIVRMECTVQQP